MSAIMNAVSNLPTHEDILSIQESLQRVVSVGQIKLPRRNGSRSWHCGNGGRWGEEKVRKSSKVARVAMRDEALNGNYAHVGVCEYRTRHQTMFNHFKDHASQGDIVFLHCSWQVTAKGTILDCADKSVTHYGIYTGGSPRKITRLDCQETCPEVGDIGDRQWAIPIERWIPIPRGPFAGDGEGWRKGTLYEVTDSPNYTSKIKQEQ